jgi:site-specific DNA recombinase
MTWADGQKYVGNWKDGKSSGQGNKDSFFVTQAFNEVAMNLEPIEIIRRKFNEAGMKLGKSMFNDMLKNVVYAGKIIVPEYKKELATIVDGIHQPLIDMETFIRVQEIIRGKRWHGLKRSHDNIVFPLRGFLTCEVCGGQITGSISKGRSKKYGYYHCRQKCKTRISVEDTHLKVSGLLKNLQINQNVKELFVDVLKDSENTISGNRKAQLKTKIDRQQALKNNMEKADELLLKSSISLESYNGMANRINAELMEIKMEIEELHTSNDSIKEYVENGLELLTGLEKWFLESDYDDKRILVGSLFNQKLILGNNGCRTTTVNEVLNVLTRNSKGFEGIKKGKAIISESFSASVPGVGIEPTFS